MKNLKYSILTIMFSLFAVSLFAKHYKQAEKTVNKTYNVNESTNFKIVNKFGDINIKNWQKNEIKINVTITSNAKTQENANKILDRITIEFSKDSNNISAITTIAPKPFKFFTIENGDEYTIEYEIFAPVYLKLNINNKFGDVFINEIHSKSDINVKYGDLRANNLLFPDYKPYSKISVSYGGVKINKISWCNIISKYSELEINKSTALFIYGRYSEYNFTSNNAIICDSKYDEYTIDTTNNFVLTGAYNDVKIKNLNKQLVIDSKYGDYNIKNISPYFTKIRINSDYSDFSIGISKQSKFNFTAEGKYLDINLPKNICRINDDDENILLNTKYNGESKNIFYINSDFGDINIYFSNKP